MQYWCSVHSTTGGCCLLVTASGNPVFFIAPMFQRTGNAQQWSRGSGHSESEQDEVYYRRHVSSSVVKEYSMT